MTDFTHEFIASQLAIAEKATPRPWLDLWKKPDGLDKEAYNSIKNNDGIEVLSVEWYDGPMLAITENNSAYLTESANHYPDALREIARLMDVLRAADDLLMLWECEGTMDEGARDLQEIIQKGLRGEG